MSSHSNLVKVNIGVSLFMTKNQYIACLLLNQQKLYMSVIKVLLQLLESVQD